MIDTDILIDALRGLTASVNFLAHQHAAGGISISIISAMELIAGCRNGAELRQIQSFAGNLVVLPITSSSSQTARQLMESYFLSHGLLIPDALIAATALDQALPLYTKNVRHFQMIPLLSVTRPY